MAAGVAMGMMRSTPSETNSLQMSFKVAVSAWPFCTSNSMAGPPAATLASERAVSSLWMAVQISSRLEWLVYCTIPTLKLSPSALPEAVEAVEAVEAGAEPQAASDRARAAAVKAAKRRFFFMVSSSFLLSSKGGWRSAERTPSAPSCGETVAGFEFCHIRRLPSEKK